jgi:hypothetical protein
MDMQAQDMQAQKESWAKDPCPASATLVRFLEALLASGTLTAFMAAWYCAPTSSTREDPRIGHYYRFMQSAMLLSLQEQAAHLRSLGDTESAENWIEQQLRVLLPAGTWLMFTETTGGLLGSATRTERFRAASETLAACMMPPELVDVICERSV